MTGSTGIRFAKLGSLLLIALLLGMASASAAGVRVESGQVAASPAVAVTVDLWATTGTTTMPDGASVPIWGFADAPGAPASLPGPIISVNEGDALTFVLHNELTENVSIVFPGQDLLPDHVGAPPGGMATYAFTAANPGAFLYESGVNPQKQVQMGLYGALLVSPTTPGQAYNDADGRSAFDKEAVLLLSEVDPAFHTAVDVGASYDLLSYSPDYFLINGKGFPQTDTITAAAGERVLLRYLNAGSLNHSLLLLGMSQTVIAQDGRLLNFAYDTFSQTVVSGETLDLISTVPAGAASGTKFPLFLRSRAMHTYSSDVSPGGMMTFITAQ
jgi:FtsP/CotA-like multicopper oxidase with cupredoxin domain